MRRGCSGPCDGPGKDEVGSMKDEMTEEKADMLKAEKLKAEALRYPVGDNWHRPFARRMGVDRTDGTDGTYLGNRPR